MLIKILLVVDGSSSPTKIISFLDKLKGKHLNLTAVYVINNRWQNILGDEWISSKRTRGNFFRYMEKKQQQEAGQILDKIIKKAQAMNLPISTLFKTGQPQQAVLSAYTSLGPFDIVVLPSTMKNTARVLTCPVFTGPL
ncbi:hypothetical protein JOC37_001251 [Desulfohalotomaculum tongense]|uniref:universal stress protein n=1 Tax=Desulforadius tongensis TaxID=1216062 RepID=UPI00195BEC49|nr:universal stress protein [Desulforadius tongensis]MBM7854873.1 hypothetical protein [Desulforadius tongensis]